MGELNWETGLHFDGEGGFGRVELHPTELVSVLEIHLFPMKPSQFSCFPYLHPQ
jgi:hypothetical protein